MSAPEPERRRWVRYFRERRVWVRRFLPSAVAKLDHELGCARETIADLRGELAQERERSANLLESVLDLRDETKRLAGLDP